MKELKLEIGIKLDKDYEYYKNILIKNGLINDLNVKTHDIYYTNKSLDNLTENEMKNACIRIRNVSLLDEDNPMYKIQNNKISNIKDDLISKDDLGNVDYKLNELGYKKVIDTKKVDHQFCKEGMNSKIQLQEIADIGLILYYDNPKYYEYPLEEQRRMLIDELNSYGFNISYDDLGLDKLRTLYYKKEMYSLNQNA